MIGSILWYQSVSRIRRNPVSECWLIRYLVGINTLLIAVVGSHSSLTETVHGPGIFDKVVHPVVVRLKVIH